MASQIQRAGGVVAGRDIHHPAAGLATSINRLLNRGLGGIIFVAGRAIIADIENCWLGGHGDSPKVYTSRSRDQRDLHGDVSN